MLREIEKKMKKHKKKLDSAEKKGLKFLVEDFLERNGSAILKRIKDSPDEGKILWDELVRVLLKDSFWMDEVDQEDLNGTDFGKLVLEYHRSLNPIWQQIKTALFDFKYRVVPERGKTSVCKKGVGSDASSILSQYKDLLNQDTVIDWEQFYDIKTTVSFDPGRITFYKRGPNVLRNFLDLLADVPISNFARCEHCAKCIIVTRSDRRYCHGCAAKKYQEDKRREDPERFKQKERERYQKRRKKKAKNNP